MDGGVIMKPRWAELSEYLQCCTEGWGTTRVKLVGRGIQKAGSGSGIIKAEPSLLWSSFFSLYYGRSRPGRS